MAESDRTPQVCSVEGRDEKCERARRGSYVGVSCSVEGCGQPAKTKGMCARHYGYFRKHGVAVPPHKRTSRKERLAFLKGVVANPPEGCVNWPYRLNQFGYGVIMYKGVRIKVHRLAYDLYHSTKIDEDLCARHKCDNRACCNPRHIEPGTLADNNRDRDSRGRGARGEKAGRAVLTEANVHEMRRRFKEGATGPEMAEEFGVSLPTAYAVKYRQSWSWLSEEEK